MRRQPRPSAYQRDGTVSGVRQNFSRYYEVLPRMRYLRRISSPRVRPPSPNIDGSAGSRCPVISREVHAQESDPESWLQRVGVLAMLPQILEELGVDCGPVLAEAGLPESALDRPDLWVPAQGRYGRLKPPPTVLDAPISPAGRAAVPALADRAAGELMLNSRSVGEALGSYVVHQRLYSQGFTPYLQKYRRTAEFGFGIYHSTSFGLAVTYDVLLAALVSALRSLCGPEWNHPKSACRAPLPPT